MTEIRRAEVWGHGYGRKRPGEEDGEGERVDGGEGFLSMILRLSHPGGGWRKILVALVCEGRRHTLQG